MPTEPALALSHHFAKIDDPRIERTKRHSLLSILTIALCGVICGAESWTEIEDFGHAKEAWLRTFLDLPHGIPSHDTFGRVFARLNPEQFRACFVDWVRALQTAVPGGEDMSQIAIDGKTVRRSHDRHNGRAAIHMVSAWASQARLVLAQTKVDEKSNEITAIPFLLEQLVLTGCIVTIDAMGCQTKIATAIVDGGGDYCLALKGNQETLQHDVEEMFALARHDQFEGIAHDYARMVNKGHGRIEIRRHWVITEPEWIAYLNPHGRWKGLRAVGMVEAERRIGQERTREVRYYLLSWSATAQEMGSAVRSHWGVENSLHWVLDVVFDEDHSRVRKDHAPQNLAVIRQIAVNLLKQEKTAKGGIQAKRLQAAWDETYLLKVLSV
jgi:predicted transposase YbfD/YdcC